MMPGMGLVFSGPLSGRHDVGVALVRPTDGSDANSSPIEMPCATAGARAPVNATGTESVAKVLASCESFGGTQMSCAGSTDHPARSGTANIATDSLMDATSSIGATDR